MAVEINAIVYQGLQRTFRNSIVGLLRTRLKAGYPCDYVAQLKQPLLREWSGIEDAARSSRSAGALDVQVVDEFDLIGINHFFNIFDKHWAVLVGAPTEPKTRQSVLNWLREIKTVRDPLSHPCDADLSPEDAYHVLDCARRVLRSLGMFSEADEIKVKQQAVFGNQKSVEPLDAKLPARESIVVDFIGRAAELADLMAWVGDPVSRRWALAGEGGKGKSALAYAFAAQVVRTAPEPLQTVLWLTAKRRHFVDGKTVALDMPDFSDLSTALDSILAHYGWLEELTLPIESRRSRVMELLHSFPALIVVDDVDSLEAENEDVIEFFTLQVPLSLSKVLITSRRTIFGFGGSTTHITGFGESEGIDFILSRSALMGLDASQFGKALCRDILRVSEGSPLYIEDILRLSASVKSVADAVKAWSGRLGSEARKYALGRECELLSPSARKVLLSACVPGGAVTFVELEAISGLPADAVTHSLQELQKLFLIPKPRLIAGEQKFDVNVNTKSLVREVYGSSPEFKAQEAAYRAISAGAPLVTRGRIAGLVRQASILVRGARGEEGEQLLLSALEVYPNDPDLLGALGWLYKAWSPVRLTDARERFRRAYQLRNVNEDTYVHWSKMESREQDWARAAEAAECGINLLPASKNLLFLAGRARCRLARELAAGLHREKSESEAKHAEQLLENALKIRDPSAVATDREIYRALVLVAEIRADASALRRNFRRWQRFAPEDGDLVSEWQRLSAKFKLGSLDPVAES